MAFLYSSSSSSLVFKVQRSQHEFITAAEPTPYESKKLSDIDDQEGLRFRVPGVLIFKKNETMEGKDPVEVIRKAISKTLVYYYPLAGSLRQGLNRKLTVECTGEGVMFIEADADISLEQFGDVLHPPIPGWEQLLYDVPGSSGILDSPLCLIQVTRFRCGGFVFAIRVNHTICDGLGTIQFMKAIGEMARGASIPSVTPVWDRELLSARDPPRVTCVHHKCDQMPPSHGVPHVEMTDQCFFFGPQQIAALRSSLASHLSNSTTFELVTACIWRCRTIALNIDPTAEIRLLCPISVYGKVKLPRGYYGNAVVFSTVVAKAGEICQNPLGYTLVLVKKLKAEVTEEYVRSFVDLMVIKGRPHVAAAEGSYVISDLSRLPFGDVDFGWGNPIYGGPAAVDMGMGPSPGVASFLVRKGENGIVVPILLPGPAMERFVMELHSLINQKPE